MLLKYKLILIAAFSACALSSCSESMQDDIVEPTPSECLPIVIKGETLSKIEMSGEENNANTALNNFSLRFFNLVNESKSDNFALSPVSNVFALAMMANACENFYAQELCAAIGCDNMATLNSLCKKLMMYLPDDSHKCKMTIANSVWHLPALSPTSDFLSRMNEGYFADVKPIDFSLPQAADTINLWVDTKTEGLIEKLVTHDMISAARLVTVNALYFNGSWEFAFNKLSTVQETFHGIKKDSKVDFMHQLTSLPYCKNDFGEWISLPYENNSYQMILALPNEDSSVNEFLKSFDASCLSGFDQRLLVDNSLAATPIVKLSLPKFNIEHVMFCTEYFKRMGISGLADGITGFICPNTDGIKQSEVIHKSVVNVNEEGSSAASATANIYDIASEESSGGEIIDMNFNRPFVFFITNVKTGSIIIAGKIAQL